MGGERARARDRKRWREGERASENEHERERQRETEREREKERQRQPVMKREFREKGGREVHPYHEDAGKMRGGDAQGPAALEGGAKCLFNCPGLYQKPPNSVERRNDLKKAIWSYFEGFWNGWNADFLSGNDASYKADTRTNKFDQASVPPANLLPAFSAGSICSF